MVWKTDYFEKQKNHRKTRLLTKVLLLCFMLIWIFLSEIEALFAYIFS